MMRRHHLMRIFLVLIFLCAITSRVHAQLRPNFLFIYTDDQRWDAMSCIQEEMGDKARFPWFKTPNMDRLAREGARFRNMFVVNSLCAPSRSCFVTGTYSHINGVVNNHMPAPLDRVTSATVLHDAGYETAYFGKWHHDNQKDRPGFEKVCSFVGQGKYIDCPLIIDGKMTETHGWIDDVVTDYLVTYLKERKAGDRPFDVVMGFKSPHDPRTPPERAKDRFAGEELKPAVNRDARAIFRTDDPSKPAGTPNARREKSVIDHFRCVSAADDCLGRILDALDETGLAKNTVVIFTSDNGYYFGEHGLGDKRSAYEDSMRIPLVMRYPGVIPAGKVIDEMALNIDVAPTLIDLAGAKVPESMQGMSWKPLVTGEKTKWREAFWYEYFYEKGYGTPTTLAVRTDDAKYIEYPGHAQWTELFDLKSDPYEMKNLASDGNAKALLERMRGEFEKQKKEVKFEIPGNADKVPGPGEDPGHF
jgi:arylsulfatase A-like enzyme